MTNLSNNIPNYKEDPILGPLERELRKGNFLTEDPRPLSRIIDDDAAECSRLNLHCESAGLVLERLIQLGRAGLGDPVVVDELFEVSVTEHRGALPCPWGDHFFSLKAIVESVNLSNRARLRFTPLSAHFIRRHAFFQGKGSPFRIEPTALVRLLEGSRLSPSKT